MTESQSIRMVATLTLSVLVVVVASNIPFIDGVPDTSLHEYSCSTDTWAANDPYEDNVLTTLSELVWRTPGEPDSQLEWVGTHEGTTVYAEAGCEQHLDGDECFACLGANAMALNNWCYHKITGSVQLVDCGMRYSNQPLE